jgi:hypothetical protein
MDTPKGSSVLSGEIAWIMSLSSVSSLFVTCSAARPHLALNKDAPIPRATSREQAASLACQS